MFRPSPWLYLQARRAAFERTQQQCAGSPIPSPGVGGGAGVGGTLAAGGAGGGAGGAGGPVRMLPTKRSSAPGAQQLLGLYAAQSPSGLLRAGQALLERPFSGASGRQRLGPGDCVAAFGSGVVPIKGIERRENGGSICWLPPSAGPTC